MDEQEALTEVEPNCLNCIHVCGGFDCERHCGPAHWWVGFSPISNNQEG